MATGKPPLAHMDKMAALFYIGAQRGLMPSLPDGFSVIAKDFVRICLTRWDHASSLVECMENCFLRITYPLNPGFFILAKNELSNSVKLIMLETEFSAYFFYLYTCLGILWFSIIFAQLQWPETTAICGPAPEAFIHPQKWDWSKLLGNTEEELLWSPTGTVWLTISYTETEYFWVQVDIYWFNLVWWIKTQKYSSVII